MTDTVRRRAKLTKHKCGADVVVGLDAPACALVATCDPYPVSNAGEVEALRAGRRTYLVWWGELDPRDRWNIAGKPADITTVLVEHSCGDTVPSAWRKPLAPQRKPEVKDEWF